MKGYAGSPSLDAGLIAAAQAVEHYEMARYGTLATWATQLGLTDAVALLDETLQEGEADGRPPDAARRRDRKSGGGLTRLA